MEVLVVLAIIAIIAAILFPVFSRAKVAARQSNCMSNLRQIGSATFLYSSDNDDTLPPADPTNASTILWADLVMPYQRNRDILNCPESSNKMNWSQADTSLPWSYNYAYNAVLDDDDTPIGAAGSVLTEILQPALTVLFIDGWPLDSDPGAGNSDSRYVIDWVWGERDRFHHPLDDGRPSHNGSFEFIACDGHVKSRYREQRSDGTFSGGTFDIEWLRDPET